MMRGLFGKNGSFGTALALTGWLCYVGLSLQHFYDTTVRTPQTTRVPRMMREVRLPRLYFCPADRGHMSGFQWASFQCTLSYKDEHRSCFGRLESFRGRTPQEFQGTLGKRQMGEGPGENGEQPGGQCLEFSTHKIGVREEWSAAWNEITLRAAFHPPQTAGFNDAFQEVELGYVPEEWEMGMKSSTVQRYYYPLLRVPFFYNHREEVASGKSNWPTPGVATRMYLRRKVDEGRSMRAQSKVNMVGEYWRAYDPMQIAVVNSSTPPETFEPEGSDFLQQRLGVVHIVITLEDFEEFDYEVVSGFFPLMGVIGQIAGVGALLALAMPGKRKSVAASGGQEELAEGQVADPSGGPPYSRVACPDDDDDVMEQQALLGGSSEGGRREGKANQALLTTEEGLDGL